MTSWENLISNLHVPCEQWVLDRHFCLFCLLFMGIHHLPHMLTVPPTKVCLLWTTPTGMDLYIQVHAQRLLLSAVPWISEDCLLSHCVKKKSKFKGTKSAEASGGPEKSWKCEKISTCTVSFSCSISVYAKKNILLPSIWALCGTTKEEQKGLLARHLLPFFTFAGLVHDIID